MINNSYTTYVSLKKILGFPLTLVFITSTIKFPRHDTEINSEILYN